MEKLMNAGDWATNMINVSESKELDYWTNFFKVTPEQLKTAIKALHNCAADQVQLYLRSHIHN